MIHVSRSGATLGVFEEEKVREGLRTGEFIGTDLGWMEGMAAWRPLAELEDFRTAAPPPPVAPVAAILPTAQSTAPSGSLATTARTGLPWENRDRTSWFNALLETIQMVLLRPVEAFSVMKREAGFLDPLLYSIILGMAGALISFAFSIGLQSFGMGLGRENGIAALFGMGVSSVLVLVLMPVLIIFGTFIGAGISHLCLMITGGANQPFETTFRVFCFAAGSVNVFQVVPVCGGSIAVVYSIVLNCIGLARAHETETWRAVVAVLLPMILCCGGAVVFFFFLLGSFAGSWR